MAISSKWGETDQIAGLTTLRGTWGVRLHRSAYVTGNRCYYRANLPNEGIINDLKGLVPSTKVNAVQI